MCSQLDASTRGQHNIANGEAVDREKDLEGVTLFDPETNPYGVIDASGASNALMRDWLASYCAANYDNSPVDECKWRHLLGSLCSKFSRYAMM